MNRLGASWTFFIWLMILFLVSGHLKTVAAQNGIDEGVVVSIRAAAEIIESSEVNLVTLRDVTLDRQVTRQGIVQINPRVDAQAGKMRAEGRRNTEVRISFTEQMELTRVGGSETLIFNYSVSGNNVDDQSSSELLDLDNRDFMLNDDGEFYFWVGGRVDIRNAVQGNYDGEFTIEIEYL